MANKRFEAAIISKDVVAIVDADVNFHDIIYAMTDNQRLAACKSCCKLLKCCSYLKDISHVLLGYMGNLCSTRRLAVYASLC